MMTPFQDYARSFLDYLKFENDFRGIPVIAYQNDLRVFPLILPTRVLQSGSCRS